MANLTVDLLTGKLYLFNKNFSGGTTSGSTYPSVNLYSDLPQPAGDFNGQIYAVRTSSGIYVINRKEAGLYISTSNTWKRMGDIPSFFTANNFQIVDNINNTKGISFITSGITSGVFRKVEFQNSDGTIAYLIDLNTKVDVSIFNTYTGITAPNTYLKLNQTIPQNVSGGTPQFNAIQFNLTGETEISEGKLQWDMDAGTLQFGLPGGNVIQQIGQETLVYVTNKTGFDLLNGQIVYANGAQGSRPTIGLASALISPRSIGMLTEDINNNNNGYVTISGLVHDVNTISYSAGTMLFLGITAGTYTNIRPPAPYYQIPIGIVLYQHASNGIILFNPKFSYKMEDLADVDGTPLTISGQFPVWNNDTEYFDFTSNINDYYNKTEINNYTGSTFKRTVITASTYVPLNSDRIIALLGTTGDTVHVNLPNISVIGSKVCWTFKDEGFNAEINNIIFSAFTGNFIEKTTNATLAVNGGAITIYNDGATNWYII